MDEVKLVSYRDAGFNTYTYFWVDFRGKTVSPYFDSQADANKWLEDNKELL